VVKLWGRINAALVGHQGMLETGCGHTQGVVEAPALRCIADEPQRAAALILSSQIPDETL